LGRQALQIRIRQAVPNDQFPKIRQDFSGNEARRINEAGHENASGTQHAEDFAPAPAKASIGAC
jgi:hypothetical protein